MKIPSEPTQYKACLLKLVQTELEKPKIRLKSGTFLCLYVSVICKTLGVNFFKGGIQHLKLIFKCHQNSKSMQCEHILYIKAINLPGTVKRIDSDQKNEIESTQVNL